MNRYVITCAGDAYIVHTADGVHVDEGIIRPGRPISAELAQNGWELTGDRVRDDDGGWTATARSMPGWGRA